MPALESDETLRALTSKLQCRENRKGDHIKLLLYDPDGTFLAYTEISHGSRHTLGPGLVSKMAKQLNLRTGDLVALVSCSRDREYCLRQIKSR